MRVKGNDVSFQLDSGADVNICARFVNDEQILPTQQTLTMWNGSSLKPLGKAVQKRLTEALHDLKSIICVADDIVVVGRGNTKEAADKNNAENISELQQRCKEKNIHLNEKKAVIKKDEITFMRHSISVETA